MKITLTFTVAGKDYTLTRPTPTDLDAWQKWATAQLPDPVREALELLPQLPKELQAQVLQDALAEKRKRNTGQSADAQALLQTPAGVMFFFRRLFIRNHPTLTDEEIADVLGSLEAEQGSEQVEALFHSLLGVKDEAHRPGAAGNSAGPAVPAQPL